MTIKEKEWVQIKYIAERVVGNNFWWKSLTLVVDYDFVSKQGAL